MSQDKLNQQTGPQQGNIHQESNEGQNQKEHAGSTLGKVPDPEQLEGASDKGRDAQQEGKEKHNRPEGDNPDPGNETIGTP